MVILCPQKPKMQWLPQGPRSWKKSKNCKNFASFTLILTLTGTRRPLRFSPSPKLPKLTSTTYYTTHSASTIDSQNWIARFLLSLLNLAKPATWQKRAMILPSTGLKLLLRVKKKWPELPMQPSTNLSTSSTPNKMKQLNTSLQQSPCQKKAKMMPVRLYRT